MGVVEPRIAQNWGFYFLDPPRDLESEVRLLAGLPPISDAALGAAPKAGLPGCPTRSDKPRPRISTLPHWLKPRSRLAGMSRASAGKTDAKGV